MRRRATEPVGEARAIALLRRQLDRVPSSGVTLGNGDDAAVLEGSATPWVWSIDSSAERTHFDLRWVDLATAARRAFHAAVSDLAAMGATPVAALCALTVPPAAADEDFTAVARGQGRASRELCCPVIGGNIERGRRWRFVTSVLGRCAAPLARAGAKPGDELWLLGRVGYAAAGLELLRRGTDVDVWPPSLRRLARQCIHRWQRPDALIDFGLQLATCAHAAIDVSDGLASELKHLALAGGVELHLQRQALKQLARPLLPLAKALNEDAEQWVLHGGEDYALLAAGPRAERPREAKVLGQVCAGTAKAVLVGEGLAATSLGGGYDHLRSRQ